MKKVINHFACFLIFGFLIACKKDSHDTTLPIIPEPPILSNNKPPIANAGPDQTITLTACYGVTATAELDGSNSTDPDNNIINYEWKYIKGNAQGLYPTSSSHIKAKAEALKPGEYEIELTVKDAGGLFSKDTMKVTIQATPEKYELDLLLQSMYTYIDNFYECDWNFNCVYIDIIKIDGKGIFLPIGKFNAYLFQSFDSAATNTTITGDYMDIYVDTYNGANIFGYTSLNLKELISKGGGSFAGLYKVTSGSATQCDKRVLENLVPLSITGTLDTVTRNVTLRIKGSIYF